MTRTLILKMPWIWLIFRFESHSLGKPVHSSSVNTRRTGGSGGMRLRVETLSAKSAPRDPSVTVAWHFFQWFRLPKWMDFEGQPNAGWRLQGCRILDSWLSLNSWCYQQLYPHHVAFCLWPIFWGCSRHLPHVPFCRKVELSCFGRNTADVF